MFKPLRFALVTMVLSAGFIACSSRDSCACVIGPNTNVTGSYSGTIQDSGAGPGATGLNLTQNGATVTGSISGTFPNSANNFNANLNGTISGNTLSLTATSSNPSACSVNVTATASGNQISGSYATASGCASPDNGTFSVTKQ